MPVTKPLAILTALGKKLPERVAHRLEAEHYRSRRQSPYSYNGTSWVEINTAQASAPSMKLNTSTIRLISWNIDILTAGAEIRMEAALSYLETLVLHSPPSTPIIIFLQEMGRSDLQQIRRAKWIQSGFYITHIYEDYWLDPLYGTATLIDRRLKIGGVFRVPWISKFERDGLFVDIEVESAGKEVKVFRLCNTHLESLIADPPVRPLQMEAAGKYLREKKVAAALLAGDLNAIQPFDRTLHEENGLKDSYLELGGKEESEEGYTWGYQVPQEMRERFGCSRMDKILFRGDVAPISFERIGIDVKVAEDQRQAMRDAGEEEWVTDHYGVMGDFQLDGWNLGSAKTLSRLS